ncbi:hypothetical protein L7F22_030777 [Adiantum nelumboides]|nr:hypothetical protein [Adiantum nelumboides]
MSAVLALPQVKDFLKTLAKGKEKGQEQRKEHDVNGHAITEEGEPSKKPWDEDIPELSSPSYYPPTSFSYSSDSSSSSNPRRRSKSTKRNQPKKFEKYVDYALDVPMYFAYRNKQYVDCSGLSFRDFMVGKLLNLPGEKATINDWENHLTTIFPEVRLKKFLEMRGADGGPWRKLCALPAFWVGLLYDETSLQGALEIIKDWTQEERTMLRRKVPSMGLRTPFRDGLLRHIAQEVVNLAKDGLQRRGYKEAGFLSEILEVVNTGITPAEKLLEKYKGDWKENVSPVYEELLY